MDFNNEKGEIQSTKSELEQRNKHGPMHGSLNVPIEHHPTIRYMVYNGYYKVMSNIPQMGQLPTPAMEGESVDFKLQHPAVKKSSRLMPGRRRPPSWSKVHGSLKADCRNTTQPKPKIGIDGTHGKSIRDGKSSFLSPLLEVSMISSHCGSMNFR